MVELSKVRIAELKYKDVINTGDGLILGSVNDIEVDVDTAKIAALVIYGRPKLFGLLGREEDIVISWDQVEVIGDDTILVNYKKRGNSIVNRNTQRFFE